MTKHGFTAMVLAIGCVSAGPTTRPSRMLPTSRVALSAEQVDATTVARWVDQLQSTDGVARETAIRRLVPHQSLAGRRVAELFGTASLAGRLSALELLSAWKAPIDGLDPWQPETITPARVRVLKQWAANIVEGTAPPVGSALSASDLLAARQELGRLLATADPAQALAIRERLARLGPALMPEILAQLKNAVTETARQRLTILRYRLVASDPIALQWPGGLEQLSVADTTLRRDAVWELGRRANSADAPLLLELFSDPDPIIREMSLRALQAAGGPGAIESLTQLLHDPEPNVRAAVLKQLAETPSLEIVPRLVKYIAEEKDTDLVVHAIRALRATKDSVALDPLIRLMRHESWRVKAEAIDAAVEIVSVFRGPGADVNQAQKMAVYNEFVRLLDDPDGFVVGRAMLGLKKADSLEIVSGMMKASKQHPELAPEIVRILSHNNEVGNASIAELRAFTKHPVPSVRAAAIGAICSVAPDNCREELAAGLTDPASEVRMAAAIGVAQMMARGRPQAGYVTRRSFLGFSETRVKVDPNEWLDAFRSGKDRPAWFTAMGADLEKMAAGTLPGASPDEQVLAAVPLAALGNDAAWAALKNAVGRGGKSATDAAGALPWLPWEKRLELFNLLIHSSMDEMGLVTLSNAMTALDDPRITGPLWDLLGQPEADANLAATISYKMDKSYFGDQFRDDRSPAEVQRATTDAKEKLGGTEMQRAVALALLTKTSRPDAGAAAERIFADPHASPTTRVDAFEVLLAIRPLSQGRELAIQSLTHPTSEIRKMALTFLAGDHDLYLRGRIQLEMNTLERNDENQYFRGNEAVVLAAPKGIKAEMLRPFLKDPDDEIAAYSGYLLAMTGDREGIAPVVRYWRDKGQRYSKWRRMVYRAIAAVDDDSQTPVLEEMFNAFSANDYQKREFYATIRRMKGPNARKFIERIKNDAGIRENQ